MHPKQQHAAIPIGADLAEGMLRVTVVVFWPLRTAGKLDDAVPLNALKARANHTTDILPVHGHAVADDVTRSRTAQPKLLPDGAASG